MNKSASFSRLTFAVSLLCSISAVARADILSGSSSSIGVFGSLLHGDTSMSLGPAPLSTGFAPNPYSTSVSLVAPNFSSGFVSFSAGLLATSVESDVDGTSGSKLATASMTATGFTLAIDSILSFAGTSWQQISSAQGDAGSFDVSTDFTSSGLSLTILGSPVALANGTLYDEDGLTVSFRDSSLTFDPAFGQAVGTGLFVSFINYEHEGHSLNGQVLFGSTQASLSAVPEPATMLALGLPALALAIRRRK